MAMSRWDPFRELSSIQNELNRLFGRTYTLPSTADPDGIQASFDAGVLTIEVPKKEEAKPRKIKVKATG
jgi:HSP20 family molecular chaperone IbpA